jgi:hypothetical protein
MSPTTRNTPARTISMIAVMVSHFPGLPLHVIGVIASVP